MSHEAPLDAATHTMLGNYHSQLGRLSNRKAKASHSKLEASLHGTRQKKQTKYSDGNCAEEREPGVKPYKIIVEKGK